MPEAPVPGTVAKSGERGSAGEGSARESGAGEGGTGRGGSAQTAQERRAAVDGKLDASLGTFDEQLKREQQRTAQQRDARASGRAGSSGSEDGDYAGGPDDPDRAGNRRGRDRSGDLRSERRTGESGDESAQAPGEGASLPGKGGGGGAVSGRVVPDGSDDDIIARRLRKAAETETDPELKEKLWKEYIDYKSNARSGR
ncbi:MAG TPA: hypothetical protein VGO41_12005 [Steroidobacteraceae bacterium]|nr:hypothetical protein [Steroidobacteraceae bacterium]